MDRRRQRKACDVCRRRKVRCDIDLHPGACSGCRKADIECRSTTQWAKPRRRRDVSAVPVRVSGTPTGIPDSVIPDIADPVVPDPDIPIPTSQDLARNGLARFFKQGIGAGLWSVFDAADFRVAYVGTPASNLAHLVDLHGASQQPLSPTATAADPAGCGRTALHYPYPPIRRPTSWKPNPADWGFSMARDLAADVSSFPVTEVRDALVAAYFRDIHPRLPVVSKPEFLAAYGSPDKAPPPLLLFQAVLMAGTHACSHPLVAPDRHAVQSILFRRAALLYHARHETDRIHLMQAALLFTWHIGDGDTVTGGPWYWSGLAVRIGCGMGVHRHNAALPAAESAQYRRCWWLAFICEVLSALETGRPCALRADDTDQVLLTDDDLVDTPGESPDAAVAGCSAVFLNRMVELCYIGLDILALSAPSAATLVDVEAIDARLGLWALQAGITGQIDADADLCQLRIHYNLLLLHLHRGYPGAPPLTPSSPSVCAGAARAILDALEQLAAVDGLAGCHFSVVSAATAAAIQTANEVRQAALTRSCLVAIPVLDQLARLLRVTARLAVHWPNAQAISDVFRDLHHEYHAYVTQDLRGEQAVIPDSHHPDWNLLLAGIHADPLPGLAAEAWLNAGQS